MKSILTLVVLSLFMNQAYARGHHELNCRILPPEVRRYLLGPVNPLKHLQLDIILPQRNKSKLDQLLRDLYNPQSPNYGHYLTPEQITQQFGPTQLDYDNVAAFFKSKGFMITKLPSRTILKIDGSVKLIEAVFHTQLKLYKHPIENREFYAPVEMPSVDLDHPQLGVIGLDNFARLHGGPHRLNGLSSSN